jgi:hypothetical protein
LDSTTKAGGNALAGIGLPELLNVGPTFNKLQRQSTTLRGSSGNAVTNTNTSGGSTVTSAPVYDEILVPERNVRGQFTGAKTKIKVPIPSENTTTSTNNQNTQSSTSSSGQGQSNTVSDATMPWYAKIAQMIGSKQYNLRGNEQPNLGALPTSALGILTNLLSGGNPVERQK